MTRFIFIVAILVFALCGFVARAGTQVNVTQKNNNLSRDGLYIDAAFTPGNAANLDARPEIYWHNFRQRLRPTALH